MSFSLFNIFYFSLSGELYLCQRGQKKALLGTFEDFSSCLCKARAQGGHFIFFLEEQINCFLNSYPVSVNQNQRRASEMLFDYVQLDLIPEEVLIEINARISDKI